MDAEDAIEGEAFEALNVPAMLELARVFQHVPENTMLADGPVLIVGDMTGDTTDVATKGGRDEAIDLTIQAVVEAEERRPLFAIKKLLLDLLHNHQAVRSGWQLAFYFVGSDGFLDPETAQAYVGNYRFKVFALVAS
jgi:hypothetical protein